MSNRSRSSRLISSFAILALAALAVPATADVVDIADARLLPPGTEVTVEGAVTVPSGAFASSTFDQGFALQDDTGGIYVSVATSNGLHLFRKVRATGVLADDGFGVLTLRPADAGDVVRLPAAERVEPEEAETGDVSEETEGRLLDVTGTITRPVVDDLPFGYQVFIDDGSGETQVFIAASTGINPFNIPFVRPGKRIRVIGFSSQFLAQYEVLPRHRLDIRRVH